MCVGYYNFETYVVLVTGWWWTEYYNKGGVHLVENFSTQDTIIQYTIRVQVILAECFDLFIKYMIIFNSSLERF